MTLMFYLSIVLMIWAGFDRGALGSDYYPVILRWRFLLSTYTNLMIL